MRITNGLDIRKISRISNGYGVFLTKEVKKLGWNKKDTFVVVRVEENSVILKRIDLTK